METAKKKFRYSIRKFKVGVGSVLIATCLLGAGVSTTTAFATTVASESTQVEATQPTGETEPTVQITGTVSTENTNLESKVAPEAKEEVPATSETPVAEKADPEVKSAEQNIASEPEKSEEPTPAPAALTSEAKEEVSENTEVKNSPLQNLKKLVKELERDLEELEVFRDYTKSDYSLQKETWESFLSVGEADIKLAHTLEEGDAKIQSVYGRLADFKHHITMERLTREVAQYRKKYINDPEIEKEYKTYLEQREDSGTFSQEGDLLRVSVGNSEAALERIKERAEKIEGDNLKTEVPKEAPRVAEKPKLDFKVQTRTTYQFLDFETKEQEDPNLPLGEKEERQKGERGEESETYQDVIVGDTIVASTLISKKRKEPVNHLIAKGTLVEKHPDTAPTAPEKPKLDFTVKERVEREILDYMVEEQDDASLPLGQTKVLREGQKGELVKKYQDVIVEGNVIASNLLSEDRKAPVNRLIAKNMLVEKHPDTAPTAPEKPKLEFTVKERVEREILDYMVEEQDDASLPLGQTKVLREGQKGELVKKYQDVIVEGNVIASNLLSEDRKAPVNRLIAKGMLVEKTPDITSKAEDEALKPMEPEADKPTPPTPEAPKTEMSDAEQPKVDKPQMEAPKTDKVESDKQMPEAKQPEMEQPKAEDMPKEEMPKAEHPKAEDSTPKTAVPEVAPKTAEKPKLDFTTKERKVEEALPIKEEIRYDASLALGKSYLLQEGKAGKKVSVYQDVIVDGKVVATNLLSETVVEGQNRILVKGSLEMKKEEVKTTPSVQSNPTLSHKGAPSANKATLPATGEQRNNLALVGLGLAGISLTVVATAINKKSKDQI
ncbi:G5 domain-containing protein [Streptococcus suis]|uniref:G5 domain-containing protein n=1 Tax=Streptococcus suis TaxID=1307 RepID=UPI0005CE3EF9|nr:G5 domain-containing protein [Streptococcus suis]NQK51716.1 YSIRK-type signal peptide-containing protein [Streptococcus suis]TQE83871.1 YSIRK-type signal peptide-containing protein [Streptococcus suis]CYU73890.1 LPXTG-motif cell wall anchor domain-containing protein [Streptococcus suis]HEL1734508.1 G5 domain-containing protein [Streptococcus suis]HEM2795791.1 G5 domain-containing protein [Streptococcus suis]